ncbi:transglutaminase family protein [Ancylothrix sp. C2]|uniref:transglutaminase-like domain-containing protein n=1 Tax=Ancylothrix sp. D3o TaxID=2953691 RepID=UPI0021BBA70E|nr:transglutaminase family protein [Ancylothrix sp. D3o]MCT7951501.1 transglutaminase family protein [Ancylothrix sp. D3o]
MAYFSPKQNPPFGTIRPYGAYALQGITFSGDNLIAIDSVRGYLLEIDITTENTTILNPYKAADFTDVTGIALWEDTLWYTRDEQVLFTKLSDLQPQVFASLPYRVDGVAVWESTVYVTCQRAGYIFIFNRKTGTQITKFYAPGIGRENITVRGEELWVSDQTEQTVYCMDRATGEIIYSVLTPFDSPTGLAFYPNRQNHENLLYVAYAGEEAYIRDDPNSPDPHQLTFRDRTFIHPLYCHYDKANKVGLSNGYLIEVSYVEELSPLEEIFLENLEWRIALPSNTLRQKVRHIEAVGMPFTEEIVDGEKIAVFKFNTLKPNEARLFGWKALIEVHSIKYNLTPRDVEKQSSLPPNFERYLVDNDNLAMDTETVRRAAAEAIGTETNLLRKVLSIRNYVYDKLSYGIKPHIDTPDIALERGVGSCGEYVGILLALMRLNGIPCRTIGRYKCPPYADRFLVPLMPDYNHVWIEFYLPDVGWVPMESNPDDIQEGGPYPLRFFMGLAWYHIEIGKGLKFAGLTINGGPVDKENVSIGELAINHVRFKILQEIPPL